MPKYTVTTERVAQEFIAVDEEGRIEFPSSIVSVLDEEEEPPEPYNFIINDPALPETFQNTITLQSDAASLQLNSDTDLNLNGFKIDDLGLVQGAKRILIRNGTVGHFETSKSGSADHSDVIIDGVHFTGLWSDPTAPWLRTAMSVRIDRLIVRNCTCYGTGPEPYVERYALWIQDCVDLQLLNNNFETAGVEATVRLNDVTRALVNYNTFKSLGEKYAFRIHGVGSGDYHVEGNQIEGRGAYMGGIIAGTVDDLHNLVFTLNTITSYDNGLPGDTNGINLQNHGSNIDTVTVTYNLIIGPGNPIPTMEAEEATRSDWLIDGNTYQSSQ